MATTVCMYSNRHMGDKKGRDITFIGKLAGQGEKQYRKDQK
jgi:hypothetical protein